MSSKLYVGGLPSSVEELTLTELFAPHGSVASALVMTNAQTGQSRGFGFVEMAKAEEANEAIASLNDMEMDGRTLTVREAMFQH